MKSTGSQAISNLTSRLVESRGNDLRKKGRKMIEDLPFPRGNQIRKHLSQPRSDELDGNGGKK